MIFRGLNLKKYFNLSVIIPPKKDEISGEELLIIITKALKKTEVPFYVIYGTCLGLYREQKLIEYDYDIDLGISYKDKKSFAIFCQNIEDHGLYIEEITHDKIKIMHPQCRYDLDIWFIEKTLNPFYLLLGKTWKCGDAYLPASFFSDKNKAIIDFQELSLRAPCPVEGYLAELYGSNWKVPQKGCYALYRRLPSQIIHYFCIDSPLPLKFSAMEEICVVKPWVSKILKRFFPGAAITQKYKHPN